MAVVFNGIDRLIEITDITIVSLDAERDLYSEWKRWSQIGYNSKYAPAFTQNSVFGGNPTIEGQAAPKYFFLTNFWRVLVDNGNVVSIGLNLYTENYSTPYLVASGSGISDRNSDAVSVNSEAIEFASYSNAVTVDQDNITGFSGTGTTFPKGTRQSPVDNLDDAKVIALARGLSEIHVIGNLNITAGDDFQRFEFKGETSTKTTIDIDDAANVLNCEFYDCTVSGTLDGNSHIENSEITNLNFVDGIISKCLIGPVIITLGTSTVSNIFGCFSSLPGAVAPMIDMNGTGILGLRDYNGGIHLKNYTGTSAHSIDLSSGQIILDSASITSGIFVVRGVGKLIDENGTNIPTGTWNGGVTIVNELLTAGAIGGGGTSVWTELEKQESLAYGKKASDNAEQANLKL